MTKRAKSSLEFSIEYNFVFLERAARFLYHIAFHLGITQIEKHGYGGGCIRKLVGVRGAWKS